MCMDSHQLTFFGQKIGFIIISNSKTDPNLIIKCLKKKADGTWEKPSNKEGKVVKLNIREIIHIQGVLKNQIPNFNSFHTFNEIKTPIKVEWDQLDKNLLWLNFGDYRRAINYPETELFKLFLDHVIQEKIEFATSGKIGNTEQEGVDGPAIEAISDDSSVEAPVRPQNKGNNSNSNQAMVKTPIVQSVQPTIKNVSTQGSPQTQNIKPQSVVQNYNENVSQQETIVSEKMDNTSVMQVEAIIERASAKAVLLKFQDNNKVWVPKSKIQSQYDENNKSFQTFLIPSWIMSS